MINEDALQQLLKYETNLMHKLLDMMLKLVSSFKTGIVNLLSQQKISISKIKVLEENIDKLARDQQEIMKSIQELRVTFLDSRQKNIETINKLNVAINQKANELQADLYKLQRDLTEVINDVQDAQSKELLDVIREQLSIKHDEKKLELETATDLRKERIKQKFALWSAILVGIIGGAFGILQLILSR